MHIGLVGGIGPAATDFYYRGLIERHAAAGVPLQCTIAHADVREMSRNLNERTPAKQAAIFAGLIARLKAAGAEAAAVTSMGGHFCINELLPISPLPLVHGIHAVDSAIARSGLKRIGVLGTKIVMESKLYGGVSAAELVAPEGAMREEVSATYSAMAQIGRVTDPQREVFVKAGRWLMRERGVEAIMLGGTDLFLAFAGREPEFPLVDCADIHVDAIFRRSAAPLHA
jgi:aspartate racemase